MLEMETLQVILQAISSVGFPIAACVVMWVQNNKMQATLAEITTAMQRLYDRVDDIEDKIGE